MDQDTDKDIIDYIESDEEDGHPPYDHINDASKYTHPNYFREVSNGTAFPYDLLDESLVNAIEASIRMLKLADPDTNIIYKRYINLDTRINTITIRTTKTRPNIDMGPVATYSTKTTENEAKTPDASLSLDEEIYFFDISQDYLDKVKDIGELGEYMTKLVCESKNKRVNEWELKIKKLEERSLKLERLVNAIQKTYLPDYSEEQIIAHFEAEAEFPVKEREFNDNTAKYFLPKP